MQWKKLGNILSPDTSNKWMNTHAGPTFAMVDQEKDLIDLYVTGRDSQNRSKVGLVVFDIESLSIQSVSKEPVLELGEKGTFDQNGTAYPWLVKYKGEYRMYYTGWIPGVLVSFMNDLGFATSKDGVKFERYSRATILPKTNEEPFGVGSVCVLPVDGKWMMWYTCFDRWGEGKDDHKHYYTIKVAKSNDGISWTRLNEKCIHYKEGEYSIAKPCVIIKEGVFHMWYSYRGETYRTGYATSLNGIDWQRKDNLAGIDVSKNDWDSEMICYSQVFEYKNNFYMIYNGNGYGKTGLGLAILEGDV